MLYYHNKMYFMVYLVVLIEKVDKNTDIVFEKVRVYLPIFLLLYFIFYF